MTRAEAVALFRREVLPAFTEEIETMIREVRARLEAGDLDAAAMRDGLTREDARLVLEVAEDFVRHVQAWRGAAS